MTDCHICGAPGPRVIEGFERRHGITADCRLWPAGARLAACGRCGCIQKVLDAAWLSNVDRIYRGYEIYYQSGGIEQPVFDASGAASPRSTRLLDRVQEAVALPQRGRLLDIGCGNGALLRSAASRLPGWRLVGTELNDKYRATVEQIPGVEGLHVGRPAEVDGQFDVITMLHVLEHLPSPASAMQGLRAKLTADGLVVIQLPEFVQNPFDLLIADHCTHFTANTLSAFLQRVGYEVVGAYQGWVPKELTVLAHAATANTGASLPRPTGTEFEQARASADWLAGAVDLARRASDSSQFGIFGTSIAATWLAGELADRVAFFVDEDPSRIGREHLGRPIYRPVNQPPKAHLLTAIPGPLGDQIAERVRSARPDVTVYTLASLP